VENRKVKILLVDDNKTNLELMKILIEDEGYIVVTAFNASDCMRKLKRDQFDLVITDFLMPAGKNGIELTEEIKKKYPQLEIMIMTAYGDVENAVKAVKLGAFDFIQRPIDNEILLFKIKKALEKKILTSELEKMKKIFRDDIENQYKIIGNSFLIRSIIEKLKVISAADSTVMITGESGVGKELFARMIHNLSSRRHHHFVAINAGAIPQNLLESELFGYKKGAFTGAYADKKGLFEEGDRGTVFLDEIGELDPAFQVKLLRVIQEGEIRPVGANKSIKVDVRIVAATNRNLKKAVETKEFREDLYYRLNVIPLEIPPLRERKEDIPLLANYFLAKYSERYKKNIQNISDSAMSALIKHSWKGNVRELENVIERGVILNHTPILEFSSLPPELTKKMNQEEKIILTYKQEKEKFDREYITKLLEYTKGNMKKAAETADKHRTDLYDMIKKYQIDVDAFRD